MLISAYVKESVSPVCNFFYLVLVTSNLSLFLFSLVLSVCRAAFDLAGNADNAYWLPNVHQCGTNIKFLDE